ncbi:hypothetical protein GMRT_12391 [Giardia muris]|uniref:Uncharacterized protein n=1 Tax=Giardia muris TaxID=5742 RepID=A0A4Z1SNB6_GIAMU|nr:hypothetical protein GMRT_12391 [Giardia muris]|eukprot:TNJ27252.1 hypothetical protein GMRT_12391 [Giardia muris]
MMELVSTQLRVPPLAIRDACQLISNAKCPEDLFYQSSRDSAFTLRLTVEAWEALRAALQDADCQAVWQVHEYNREGNMSEYLSRIVIYNLLKGSSMRKKIGALEMEAVVTTSYAQRRFSGKNVVKSHPLAEFRIDLDDNHGLLVWHDKAAYLNVTYNKMLNTPSPTKTGASPMIQNPLQIRNGCFVNLSLPSRLVVNGLIPSSPIKAVSTPFKALPSTPTNRTSYTLCGVSTPAEECLVSCRAMLDCDSDEYVLSSAYLVGSIAGLHEATSSMLLQDIGEQLSTFAQEEDEEEGLEEDSASLDDLESSQTGSPRQGLVTVDMSAEESSEISEAEPAQKMTLLDSPLGPTVDGNLAAAWEAYVPTHYPLLAIPSEYSCPARRLVPKLVAKDNQPSLCMADVLRLLSEKLRRVKADKRPA